MCATARPDKSRLPRPITVGASRALGVIGGGQAMASFTWIGGPLNSPFSWTQPDPLNPVLPGPADTVTIAGGALTGPLSVSSATLAGDLSGSITAGAVSISSLTIEA